MNPLAIMAASSAANSVAQQVYVEDLFKINLRTGTGAVANITDGPDLTGTAAVLTKSRSGSNPWMMADTERAANSVVVTSSNSAAATKTGGISSFNSDGFSIGANADYNTNGSSLVDYLFKGAPKFFDVVTWVGDGGTDRILPHAVGAMPGMAICKATSATGEWYVGHIDFPGNAYLLLNSTAAAVSTASPIPVGFDEANLYVHQGSSPYLLNAAGVSYVAYLFGNDTSTYGNIICSSYTGNGSSVGPMVDLGWEPQFVMVKNVSAASNWVVLDEMRGLSVFGNSVRLSPNLTAAESQLVLAAANASGFQPTSTVADINTNGNTYIFVAVRRQSKPPTSAATVFTPITRSGTASGLTLNTGVLTDLILGRVRTTAVGMVMWDRLRGPTYALTVTATSAQSSTANSVTGFDVATGVKLSSAIPNNSGSQITYAMRRAPQFFDQVVYSGSSANQSVKHGLNNTPELIILKSLNATGSWYVGYPGTAPSAAQMNLGSTAASATPTTSSFDVTGTTIELPAGSSAVNTSGQQYTAYLFGTCAGVSKCGTYTATGTDGQVIDCGFSSGARFVMIKRIDAAGDWFLWDSARGIVSGNDPHLSINTAVAEVTGDDSIDPDASGFAINQVAATNINVTGAHYAFMAIA